jgi:hypothetical protein
MNKRQRKKRIKKQCIAFDTELRKGLRPFIGQPLTPTQLVAMQNLIGDTIKAKLSQQSFTHQVFMMTPLSYVAPFHKWQDLGKAALVHHIGSYPYISGQGEVIWKRFCDDATVDSMYILTNDTAVTCFGCLAKEHIIYDAPP